jgi:hypothetical protein
MRAGRVAQVVKRPTSKHEALFQTPVLPKKKKKKGRKDEYKAASV